MARSGERVRAARWLEHGLSLACLIMLGAACFGAVLVGERSFGFRDAVHHYAPLHQRLAQEWAAGRVPLWDPHQNGGMPLLGNPTAAVFYPAKLLFAVLPWLWADRLYVIVHVYLAHFAARALFRSWGCRSVAASLGALSYAFGGPILLLYSNVLYLIGAAWMPLAWCAARSWIRHRRFSALLGYAVVLALIALGGDFQIALLTCVVVSLDAVCAALDHARVESSSGGRGSAGRWTAIGGVCFGLMVLAALWPTWTDWESNHPGVVKWCVFAGFWSLMGWALAPVLGRFGVRHVVQSVGGLAGAACLAAGLSAVQVLPTWEWLGQSTRASAELGFDRFGFSLVPTRVVEWIWPGVLGVPYPLNGSWRSVLPPESDPTFWVPALFQGSLTFILAFSALARGGRARWRLGAMGLVALLASMGLYAGLQGLPRWMPFLPGNGGSTSGVQAEFQAGIGSAYWLLTCVISGLELFRYPSKLLPWVALSVSGLAAFGWGDVRRGRIRSAVTAAVSLSIVSLLICITANFWLPELAGRASTTTGPFDARHAKLQTVFGLLWSASVGLAAAICIFLGRRRPAMQSALALGLLTLELAIWQRPFVWTIPSELFAERSAVADAIEAAERANPSRGPFRVHRPPVWYPRAWFEQSSPKRLDEMARWERDTLQPLHGLPLDYSYTMTLGIFESDEYLGQFRPFLRPAGAMAALLGVSSQQSVLYYPRRAFDLWNTRYFILPVDGLDWRSESRGYASFLFESELLAPSIDALERDGKLEEWRSQRDWQVFRNLRALPRVWVVHQVEMLPPLDRADRSRRHARQRALVYAADPLWTEPGRVVLDPARVAWVEADRRAARELSLDAAHEPGAEEVTIESYGSDRVVILANLRARGLVVLADAFAPGWTLTIDGQPAPVWKTNLGMRGAVVPRGLHRLEYRYAPLSFALGAGLSIACATLAIGFGGLRLLHGVASFRKAGRRVQ